MGLLSVEKPSSCLLDALREQIPCTREMVVNLLLFGLCLVLHLLLNPGRILRGHLVRPPPAAAINLDTTNSCVTHIHAMPYSTRSLSFLLCQGRQTQHIPSNDLEPLILRLLEEPSLQH